MTAWVSILPANLPVQCLYGGRIYSCSSFLPLSNLELQRKPVEGFSAGLVDDDDLFRWEVLIMGPADTF